MKAAIIIASIILILASIIFGLPACYTSYEEYRVIDKDIPENAVNIQNITATILEKDIVGHKASSEYKLRIDTGDEKKMINISEKQYANYDVGDEIRITTYKIEKSYSTKMFSILEVVVGIIVLLIICFLCMCFMF